MNENAKKLARNELYAKTPEGRQPTIVYSRIVGYLQPVASWNPGKRSEFADRLPFLAPTKEALDKMAQ